MSRSRAALAAEILFLRKQLAYYQDHRIRPRRLRDASRSCLLFWSRLFDWQGALLVVKTSTFLRWHRKGFKPYWRWKSRGGRPPPQQFDKIVSIGMFEHVGKALLPEYFGRAWHLLRPGGVFLNSGIASVPSRIHEGPSFVDRYVFPDGELVPLGISITVAETTGFEVRDVESLREHYAMTLHEWVRRLEKHADEAKRITDEVTYRIWRLYMAGSAHQFRAGDLNLYQMLLAKPSHGNAGMPLTRTDWYCPEQQGTGDPSATSA